MTKPVTWDQIIDAAADNDGTVGVQANKYEALRRLDQRPDPGRGRRHPRLLDTSRTGDDAKVTINSDAGEDAAGVDQEARRLASRPARPSRPPTRARASARCFPAEGPGEFMVNWTFVYKNYEGLIGKPSGPRTRRRSRTSAGRATPRRSRARSPSPRSAASTSASAPTPKHPDFAQEAAVVHHLRRGARSTLAVDDGLMPSRESVVRRSASCKEAYPADLLDALQRAASTTGGPRPQDARSTATISSADPVNGGTRRTRSARRHAREVRRVPARTSSSGEGTPVSTDVQTAATTSRDPHPRRPPTSRPVPGREPARRASWSRRRSS